MLSEMKILEIIARVYDIQPERYKFVSNAPEHYNIDDILIHKSEQNVYDVSIQVVHCNNGQPEIDSIHLESFPSFEKAALFVVDRIKKTELAYALLDEDTKNCPKNEDTMHELKYADEDNTELPF